MNNKMNCELMLTYDTPALRQTGSRNLTGQKTFPTIWGTYMKLVTIIHKYSKTTPCPPKLCFFYFGNYTSFQLGMSLHFAFDLQESKIGSAGFYFIYPKMFTSFLILLVKPEKVRAFVKQVKIQISAESRNFLLVLVHHVYFYIKKRKNMTFIKILLEPF
jgi:hypothetical protein